MKAPYFVRTVGQYLAGFFNLAVRWFLNATAECEEDLKK